MWNYDDYKKWLKNRLIEIKNALDFNDYNIDVFNEQDYAKNRSIDAKTITIVTKFLPSNIIFSAKTQPVQILVITEENSISVANSIVTKFCDDYNFSVSNTTDTYIKHIYSTPVVLSNFNLIGIGMRTVLYVGATLIILENVMDITNLKVALDKSNFPTFSPTATYDKDDLVQYQGVGYKCKINGTHGDFQSNEWTTDTRIDIETISATIGYTMSGDTQPFDGGYAKTEKNFSTFVMTLNVACIENQFTEYVGNILKGTSVKKGNEVFAYSFNLGSIQFTNFEMKLTGFTMSTAKNNVPSLQLSFSV